MISEPKQRISFWITDYICKKSMKWSTVIHSKDQQLNGPAGQLPWTALS